MMKGKLSAREKREIRALARASAEALVATELYMRERAAKRLEAKAKAK
jgi:hypothetical protein